MSLALGPIDRHCFIGMLSIHIALLKRSAVAPLVLLLLWFTSTAAVPLGATDSRISLEERDDDLFVPTGGSCVSPVAK